MIDPECGAIPARAGIGLRSRSMRPRSRGGPECDLDIPALEFLLDGRQGDFGNADAA
jgi:hypothetical protein